MIFAQPHWLLIGAVACAALVALIVRAEFKRRIGLALFAAASPETTTSRSRRRMRNLLAVAGVGLTFVALARPLGGYHLEQRPHQGVDLMFAVDTSKSMRATDLRPDRLTRAKLAVADLVRKFDGDRLGLIAFAGDAFVQAPMTVDRTVFLESLDALDTDVIPKGGTDIASAIRAAEQAMGSEPDHKKVLIILSDGEDLAGDVVATAKQAANDGLTIFTVGVGSATGSLIEIPDGTGHPELVRDEAGQPVRSHLDEPTLRSIAQVTGGAYQALGADGHGLETLYASAKAKLPVTSSAGTERKVFTERFQIPLALAIACFVLELAIGDHKRRRNRGAAAMASVGLAFLLIPRIAAAGNPVTTYNSATETYRKHDFAAAQKGFEDALHTQNVAQQAASYYDLGNTHYRVGEASLAKKDRDATIATWKSALASYDAALALTPYDADAWFNRNFVATKLAALEQQKKQEQQTKQQQSKNDQKQDQKDKQNGQGQPPEDQPGQPKDQKGQGQPKDQNGKQANNQGQPKDQKGQGQPEDQNGKQANNQGQPKDQKGPGQPEDQKGQGQPKDQNGQQPAPDAAQKAEAAAQKPSTPAARAAEAKAKADAAAIAAADVKRSAAGELTHGEAVQLLDSVEGDLKPMAIRGRTSHRTETTKTKDW